MKVSDSVECRLFPCLDVDKGGYIVPDVELKPERVSLILISESAPPDPANFYYAQGTPSFAQTTEQAFRDAGAQVDSIHDILEMGVYLTSAVKCAKTGYGIASATIKECSFILERELALFPNVKAFLLMGDVAIQAVNAIARRADEPRVIPAGSTYKIRGGEYFFRGRRAFPSYLQVGASYGIEKTKVRMIAEDIGAALKAAGV